MKSRKLNVRIHNPNSLEQTVEHLTNIFVKCGVEKLEKEMKKKASV